MKSERQRGIEGAWLRDARMARGYTNARAARDALERMTGHVIHYSAWASYESGGRPIGDQHKAWLEEFFGPMPEPAGGDDSDLAAAILELAAALREQAAATAARQDAQDQWMREVVAALVEGRALPVDVPSPDVPVSVER